MRETRYECKGKCTGSASQRRGTSGATSNTDSIYNVGINENYCTNASILLAKILLCGKFHGPNVFNLISCHRKSLQGYLAYKKHPPPLGPP